MPQIGVPTRPRSAHVSKLLRQTEKHYAQRPINQFPWKDLHLKMTSQGYIVGRDWTTAPFSNHVDERYFASTRFLTISEDTKVKFCQPFEPLEYSTELTDLEILDTVRRLDLGKREGFAKKLYKKTKNSLIRLKLNIGRFCYRLFSSA